MLLPASCDAGGTCLSLHWGWWIKAGLNHLILSSNILWCFMHFMQFFSVIILPGILIKSTDIWISKSKQHSRNSCNVFATLPIIVNKDFKISNNACISHSQRRVHQILCCQSHISVSWGTMSSNLPPKNNNLIFSILKFQGKHLPRSMAYSSMCKKAHLFLFFLQTYPIPNSLMLKEV